MDGEGPGCRRYRATGSTLATGDDDQGNLRRFADPLREGIPGPELVVVEDCAHAPIYENVDDFHRRTLAFLQRHSGWRSSGSVRPRRPPASALARMARIVRVAEPWPLPRDFFAGAAP